MTIDPDDRQARLEWMIDEFQQARRRWLVKRDVRAVESQTDAHTDGAIVRSLLAGAFPRNASPRPDRIRCSSEAKVVDSTSSAAERHVPGMNGVDPAR